MRQQLSDDFINDLVSLTERLTAFDDARNATLPMEAALRLRRGVGLMACVIRSMPSVTRVTLSRIRASKMLSSVSIMIGREDIGGAGGIIFSIRSGRPSSSMPATRPSLRTSMTGGTPARLCTASCQ